MSFAGLPAELQIQIFSHVDKPTLKDVRHVCTAFRNNASPELFKRSIAGTRYLALHAVQNLAQHPVYATYVKEIVFDGSTYNSILANDEELYGGCEGHMPSVCKGLARHRHSRYVLVP